MSANPLFDGNLSLTVGGVEYTTKKIAITNCSDVAPGGDASLEFTLYLSATDSPFALATNHAELVTDAVVSLTHNGNPLFYGQVCNDPSIGFAGDTAYVDVQCDGLLGKAGRNASGLWYWMDRSFDGWQFHRSSYKQFSFDNVGRVFLACPKGLVVNDSGSQYAMAWYMPHGGLSGQQVGWVHFNWSANLGNNTTTTWGAQMASSTTGYNDSLAAWNAPPDWAPSGNAGGTGQSGGGTVAMPVGTNAVGFIIGPVTETTTGGERYLSVTGLTVGLGGPQFNITNVSVANPTHITCDRPHGIPAGTSCTVVIGGLNIYGGQSQTTPAISGFYTATYFDATHFTIPLSVTVGGAVTGYGCTQFPNGGDGSVDEYMTQVAMPSDNSLATSSSTSNITAATAEYVIRDPTTPADAISQLAALYTGRIDWRFRGQQWVCNPMLDPSTAGGRTSIRALSNCYLIDATTPGVTYDVHADPEASPTYVYVLYACQSDAVYPDGTVRGVYVPSTPPSITSRVLTLDYSSTSMTAAQATNVGTQALLWYSGANSNNWSGTITIATPTVPKEVGGTLNTPYIRAGDWIEETSVKGLNANTSLMYITGRDLDVDSGLVTLTIGGRGDQFAPVFTPAVRRMGPGSGPGSRSLPSPAVTPKVLNPHRTPHG
jgi:hypothetical protein